jgi:hypothetical protein
MILPSPAGLLNDAGLIGQILRQLPPRIPEEAERKHDPWAWLARWVQRNPAEHWGIGTITQRDAEIMALERAGFTRSGIGVYSADAKRMREAKAYKGIREVCFYSHTGDPSKVFMRAVTDTPWPPSFRKTFIAANSQRHALRRLAETAVHAGSIYRSYRMEMRAAQKRGHQKAADHWANKVTAAYLRMDSGRRWLLEGNRAPLLIRREARRRYECFYSADVRRPGRKKADEKWKTAKPLRFRMVSYRDRIAEAITTGWLTVGRNGFPGLCFMSDELLAQLLGYTLPLPSLLSNTIRGGKCIWAIRKGIGLQQAEILFTGIEEVGKNKWAILDRHGKKTHWISLIADKRLPPKL